MNSKKTNRRLALSSCVILLASLSVAAFNTDKSERANEVETRLNVFDHATVADVEQVATDRSWSSTAEEIDSKSNAVAGWSICQEAIPAYFSQPDAPTTISPKLHEAIKTLTPEVQTRLADWIDLVFGPVDDGVTPDEVSLYVNNDRCGFVKANFKGNRTSIAEIFSHQSASQ